MIEAKNDGEVVVGKVMSIIHSNLHGPKLIMAHGVAIRSNLGIFKGSINDGIIMIPYNRLRNFKPFSLIGTNAKFVFLPKSMPIYTDV